MAMLRGCQGAEGGVGLSGDRRLALVNFYMENPNSPCDIKDALF